MKEYIEALIQATEDVRRKGEEIQEEAYTLPVNKRGDYIREWDIVRGEVRGLDLAMNLLEKHLRVCIERLGGQDGRVVC